VIQGQKKVIQGRKKEVRLKKVIQGQKNDLPQKKPGPKQACIE
jgi:hypothetical protein